MLCAWHNAIFTALPYKHNGQAALKSTMKVKHNVLHVIYLHFKDKWSKKPVCVTNFRYILLENQAHSVVGVLVFSKSVFKNYLSAVHCRCVFGSFWTFLAIWTVWWQVSKKPVSVTEKDISDYNYQSIYNSLWLCGSRFGCKNSLKMATENFMTQLFCAGTIKPWKWLALTMSCNISKSQKRRDITLTAWVNWRWNIL